MTTQIRPDELIRLLKPEFLSIGSGGGIVAGVDVNVVAGVNVNRAGNVVLLFDSGGAFLAQDDADDAGLTAILAAAAAGDVVWLPAVSIAGDHTVPADVILLGRERRASILTGRITLSSGSVLAGVTVTVTDTSPAVNGTVAGTAYVYRCWIKSYQSGAGEAIGFCLRVGSAVIRDSYLEGDSVAGNGYGIGVTGLGHLTDIGNWIAGSTSDVEPDALAPAVHNSYDGEASLVECGCSGGNGSATNCTNPVDTHDDVCANGAVLIGSSVPGNGTAWAIYDLGAIYTLTQIDTRWKRHGDNWIHVSEDGVNWTSIYYGRNNWAGAICHTHIDAFAPIDARFIRYKVGQFALIGDTIWLAWFRWTGTRRGVDSESVGTLFTAKADDVEPGWSAQGAWDVAGWGGARHASDLEAASPIRHLPLPQAQNDLVLVNAALNWDTLPGPTAQYDVMAAGVGPTFIPAWGPLTAAALPDHTHAGAGQGGTITHAVTTGQTADDHHSEVHVVNSTGPHAEAGLTVGHVLRASGAATFSFAAIQAADLPPHNLLSTQHGDTVINAVSRGSLIYGNATPAWSELVHPGTAYHLQTDANDVAWAQDITMAADATVDGLDLSILGDALFTRDDGLLLLGPGCEIAPTFWKSTRGQEATISGAFHQEAGEGAETRGLVVEEAGVNEEPAPRMKGTGLADGWVYWDTFGSGGSATLTVVAHPIPERGWLQWLQYTAAAGDAADYCMVYDDTAVGSFAQGDDVTISIDIKGEVSGCTCRIACYEQDAAGVAGTGHFGSTIVLTSSLQRAEYTFTTVDADCSKLQITVQIYSVDNGDSFDIEFGAANCEKADYATSFMHGGLAWCAWSGPADASTTTRAATTVNLDAHAGLISDNDTLTFMMWVQMRYDADATWPSSGSRLFDIRGANESNRTIIKYDTASDEIQVFLNGAWRITNGATQTFKAGDWKFIAVTMDYANDEYYSYADGVLDGSSTASLTAPTGLVDWQIGAAYDGGSNFGGFNIGEFAVLNSILTENEIAARYAIGKPLADAGAMTVPHADFVSGAFRGRGGAQVELARDSVPIYGSILDDETGAMTDVSILEHQSRDTVAANFGAGVLYQLEDAGGVVREAMRLGVVWEDAGANENAQFELWLNYNGTLRECGVVVGPDYASVNGNQRGVGAVDWQVKRGLATEVASGDCAVISGGANNVAGPGASAVVGGGSANVASGAHATVPGGYSNFASGDYTHAAGYDAHATHANSIVFSATAVQTVSWGVGTWTVRSHGGARFYSAAGVATGVQLTTGGNAWAAISTRASKENFGRVENILDKIAGLSMYDYNLKSQSPDIRHIGPVAEDFNDVFGFTEAPLRINMLDIASIGVAGVQALYSEVVALRERVVELESLSVI